MRAKVQYYKILLNVVFFLPLIVYLYQLCPTVYVHDSGELITASYVLGIAHPAGSPLYCMVGKLFQLIIPFGSIAFKMNALSALFAALSSVMLLVIIYKLTSDLIISFFISLTFAFSGTFWSQALVAEVYTMATFTLLCSLYFLFDYLLNAETKKLYYFALLWGLLLTIHMEYSLMTPFIWLIVFINIKKADSLFKSVKKIAKITILFFIGLVPYLYLPIRSRANTVMDWGNPETLINFYYHITAKNVQKRMFTLGFGDYIYRMQDYLMIIIKDTLFIGIIGILLLIFDYKKWRGLRLVLLTLIVVDCFFIVFLDEVPIQSEAYGIPSVLGSIMGLAGINVAFNKIVAEKWKKMLLLIPVILVSVHFSENNRRWNFIPYDYNLNMLYQMPKNSILFSREDNRTFVMVYLKEVEGRRKDIAIYDTSNNIFKNPYPDNLFLKSSEEVFKIREDVESKIITEGFMNGRYVFYTDPDMPFSSDKFKIQPCGLLGLAVRKDALFYNYYFCQYDWYIRGENDNEIKKDWMSKAILLMNYYNYAQYLWYLNPDRAIEYLVKAAAEKKYYAELHFMIGRSYLNRNYYQQALEEFNIATSINRRLWQAYVQKAFIYGKLGKYDEVIEEAMAALRINENIADAHEYLALASFKKNDYEKAEQHFLKALSLEPENFTYIYNATNFYIQVNKISEAEEFLTNLIEKNNYNNKQINILLIDLYSKSQQWEKLINFADHLKNLYPDEKEYYYALAESYIRTGNYLFAKNIVKEILLKHPEDSVGLQLQKILEEQ